MSDLGFSTSLEEGEIREPPPPLLFFDLYKIAMQEARGGTQQWERLTRDASVLHACKDIAAGVDALFRGVKMVKGDSKRVRPFFRHLLVAYNLKFTYNLESYYGEEEAPAFKAMLIALHVSRENQGANKK